MADAPTTDYKPESCSLYERVNSMDSEVSGHGSHSYQWNPAYNAARFQGSRSLNKHLEEAHFSADAQQPPEAIPVTNVVATS